MIVAYSMTCFMTRRRPKLHTRCSYGYCRKHENSRNGTSSTREELAPKTSSCLENRRPPLPRRLKGVPRHVLARARWQLDGHGQADRNRAELFVFHELDEQGRPNHLGYRDRPSGPSRNRSVLHSERSQCRRDGRDKIGAKTITTGDAVVGSATE